MGRPKTDASIPATPDRVLAAAELEFAEGGYRGAKLADIAARAGIRRPSLLYHFRTKEELYAATVERAFGRLGVALLGSMTAAGPFVERLVATADRYAEFLDGHPSVARIIVRELLDGDGPGGEILMRQVVPLVDTVEAFVKREGAEAIEDGFPVRAAILQVSTDILMRSAAGRLREPLWGTEPHHVTLTRRLFLGGPA